MEIISFPVATSGDRGAKPTNTRIIQLRRRFPAFQLPHVVARRTAAALAASIAIGCAAQAPPATTPPPAGILSGENTTTLLQVDQTLRRACYDCHSTEGHPVWNAKMAFSYWFPNDSLKTLNFSEWQGYDQKRKADTRKAIVDVVRSGDMPPVDYRLLHPSGRLSADESAAIVAWASAGDGTAAPADAAAPAPSKF